MEENVTFFGSQEIADLLKVSKSTLRKWAFNLERDGYAFKKGVKSARIYTSADLEAFKVYKSLTRKNYSMDEASREVVRQIEDNQMPEHAGEKFKTDIKKDKVEKEDLVVIRENIEEIKRDIKRLIELIEHKGV